MKNIFALRQRATKCDFSESYGSPGDFDGEFVEQYHQKGKTTDARFETPYMEKKILCVMKHEAISSNKDIMTNMLDVNTNSKLNLKKIPAAEVRLQEQKRVKTERRDKHIKGKIVITKENALADKKNVTP
jgi:alpha-amylase/alpha-mannosidase (GH57 family)